jgi:tol-pal system protein YbgF
MRRPSLLFAALFLAGAALPLAGAGAQDSTDYDKRIQRLEEQIVDLSAQLGTVETMGQGGASAPSGGGQFSGGGDEGRLSEIETQVRALSAQMNETLRRLQRIEQRSGGLAPADQPDAAMENPRGSRRQPVRETAEQEQGTGFSVSGEDKEPAGFGTNVEPGQGQGRSGGRAESDSTYGGGSPDANPLGGAAPVRTAASSSPQARALYEQSYNALVQRNYRAAGDGFEQFVQSYPSDPLAGSAFFWLGEAAFTSGEYRKAADSFLKSSTNYPQNEKAAESLLKLGISLKRLGENKAACSSFAELARRFPSATPVLQRAEREKSRAQC